MKLYSKAVAGLLATTALAFGIAAHADMGPGCQGKGMGMMREHMNMRGDPAARVDQHLSQFKAQLKITPEQEPLWQAFAGKAKAEAGQGMKAMREKGQTPMPAPERMAFMLDHMKAHVAGMESVSVAFKSLYDGLAPEQKAIADKHGAFGGHMGPGKPGAGRKGRPGPAAGMPGAAAGMPGAAAGMPGAAAGMPGTGEQKRD